MHCCYARNVHKHKISKVCLYVCVESANILLLFLSVCVQVLLLNEEILHNNAHRLER